MHETAHPRLHAWAFGGAIALVAIVAMWWIPSANSMPDTVVIPVAQPRPGGHPAAAASFGHGEHRQFTCYACHPTLFPRYPLGFTHAEMNNGFYCGSCHDGRAASSIAGKKCETCHVDLARSAPRSASGSRSQSRSVQQPRFARRTTLRRRPPTSASASAENLGFRPKDHLRRPQTTTTTTTTPRTTTTRTTTPRTTTTRTTTPRTTTPRTTGGRSAATVGHTGSHERLVFAGKVHRSLKSACKSCHVAGGTAGATAFVLTGGVGDDYRSARVRTSNPEAPGPARCSRRRREKDTPEAHRSPRAARDTGRCKRGSRMARGKAAADRPGLPRPRRSLSYPAPPRRHRPPPQRPPRSIRDARPRRTPRPRRHRWSSRIRRLHPRAPRFRPGR